MLHRFNDEKRIYMQYKANLFMHTGQNHHTYGVYIIYYSEIRFNQFNIQNLIDDNHTCTNNAYKINEEKIQRFGHTHRKIIIK